MSGDDPQQGATPTTKSAPPPTSSVPVIHRVCVQCNNMFCVSADKFDAKQCPNCHKG